MVPNYTAITGTCNIWRNFDDIQDSWQSIASVIDYYGDNQVDFTLLKSPHQNQN